MILHQLHKMRKTKTIKVIDIDEKEFSVELKSNLTWGEQEDIEEEITKGAKINNEGLSGFDMSALRKSKYKALEVYILKIKDKDEKEVKFSNEWIDNLSAGSGNVLYASVSIDSKKKD